MKSNIQFALVSLGTATMFLATKHATVEAFLNTPASRVSMASAAGGSTRLYDDLFGQQPGKNDSQGTEDQMKKETKDMSKAIPFIPRPKILDGSLPGDVGFE
jgi:hypothetical protein